MGLAGNRLCVSAAVAGCNASARCAHASTAAVRTRSAPATASHVQVLTASPKQTIITTCHVSATAFPAACSSSPRRPAPASRPWSTRCWRRNRASSCRSRPRHAPPRPGEADGREYFFTTADDFLARREAGEFLEWAEVHGNYYGTSRAVIEEQMKAGTDILLEIDWQGARQVKKQFPDAVGIFILPPSIAALEERLHKRGTGRAARHHAPPAGRRRRDRSRPRVRICYYQRRVSTSPCPS